MFKYLSAHDAQLRPSAALVKFSSQLVAVGLLGVLGSLSLAADSTSSEGFVNVQEVIPDIRTEVRYFTADNFVGAPIAGYQAAVILISVEAAAALRDIQADLAPFNLGLKIFDAYRPQQAVDHFVRWAEDLQDQRMKLQFYPQVEKRNLFRDGYIASRSGHSRGSTVDLTLVDSHTGAELDMGTPWDYFDTSSWPDSSAVTAQQRANRLLLRSVMTRHGFRPLAEEWWHFTLNDEPYPDTYFNFPVE